MCEVVDSVEEEKKEEVDDECRGSKKAE